jgi:hypothetical protein
MCQHIISRTAPHCGRAWLNFSFCWPFACAIDKYVSTYVMYQRSLFGRGDHEKYFDDGGKKKVRCSSSLSSFCEIIVRTPARQLPLDDDDDDNAVANANSLARVIWRSSELLEYVFCCHLWIWPNITR